MHTLRVSLLHAPILSCLTHTRTILCLAQGVLPGLKGPVSLSDKSGRIRTTVTHTKGYDDYILWAPIGKFRVVSLSLLVSEGKVMVHP